MAEIERRWKLRPARFALTVISLGILLRRLALSFGYFEILACSQDRSIWSREKARFTDLNGLLRRSGLDEFIWSEWVEATAKLFDDLAATETEDAALQVIQTSFNNPDESIEILTHLRVSFSQRLLISAPILNT